MDGSTTEALLDGLDRLRVRERRIQRQMLGLIAELDGRDVAEEHGAHGTAHLVSMWLEVSGWKADRWVAAARALEQLPGISSALERGEIGVDKVVELTRFATPDTEARLLRWAGTVSSGAIRRRADLEARRSREEAEDADRDRRLVCAYPEPDRFEMLVSLPAADGAVVESRLEREAASLPVMPGEEDAHSLPARLADALVALCLRGSDAAGTAAATIVVHAPVEVLASPDRSARLEAGGVVHAETLRRLSCDSRIQVVAEDGGGNAVGFGRLTRVPSEAMLRQLRYRDGECRFPGCGARAYLKAHHIRWWSRGGRTDLDNLVLICTFHHKLVHEYGWSLARDPDDSMRWYRSDGTRYRAGPPVPQLRSA